MTGLGPPGVTWPLRPAQPNDETLFQLGKWAAVKASVLLPGWVTEGSGVKAQEAGTGVGGWGSSQSTGGQAFSGRMGS